MLIFDDTGFAKQGKSYLFSGSGVEKTEVFSTPDPLNKYGKAKALSALAHKLGRAFYHMLHTKEVFDAKRFVRH